MGERDKKEILKNSKVLLLCYVNSSFWKSFLVVYYQTNSLEHSDILVMSGTYIYLWAKETEPGWLSPALRMALAQQKIHLRWCRT